MSATVSWKMHDGMAVITIDNPPVNVLSQSVRHGLVDVLSQVGESEAAAAVLHCAGRTFVAGADIREFGKPLQGPLLPEIQAAIESLGVPLIAAIHGTALGGGLELALAAHYRVVSPDARLGLPEVKLGILPGGGGTQRVPRLVGIKTALDMMVSGKPVSAKTAVESGLVDAVIDGDLLEGALAWAKKQIAAGDAPRVTSSLPLETDGLSDGFFDKYREGVRKKTRGLPAPQKIIDCVEQATRVSFAEGMAFERARFLELIKSPESAALRHVFFAERQAARIEGLDSDTSLRPIESVGIIGAGTMGGGIAMCFANAGIPVKLLEISGEALERGLGVCEKNYQRSVAKGRFTPESAAACMQRMTGTTEYEDLGNVDLVIEAVFEDPGIKKTVFARLDEVCKPGAILATNTSYQDVNEIAAATSRPQDVVGMHFFSPANVMKLLEVVRADQTADDVLATVMKLARKIRKVPVLARVCYGFIGNRMLTGYFREAQMMLLEGATPAQVDSALQAFGMAMGPLAVADLAGLDVGYKARQALGNRKPHPSTHVADQLVEMGRMGQKSGAGFYRYDAETRQRLDDPEVEALIRAEADRLGIKAKQFTDEEIVERAIYPLINEGARILEEGIAQRPGDIDIVYLYGYGFPAHRGGPMFYADTVGVKNVFERVCDFRDSTGRRDDWQPAPLLAKLAESNGSFKDK